MSTLVTKPPILDETGKDIISALNRIAEAKESNMMSYGGAVLFAKLPVPNKSNLNTFYLIKDAFVTTTDFVVGAGVSMSAGKYFCCINVGSDASPIYKYDDLGDFVDLSTKQDVNLGAPITVDGSSKTTVEGALDGINTLASSNKTNIGDLTSLATTAKTDLVAAINEAAASGGESAIIKSNTFSAGDTAVGISIDLSGGDYTVELFSSIEGPSKKTMTYGSGVLTITFKDKPTANGTIYAVARKVGA